MLVFIDESGDSGFKVEKGSSAFFVMTMVIFDSGESASEAQRVIAELRSELRVSPEFKFSQVCNDYKDSFFERVAPLSFRTRSIVVRTEIIYSPGLRGSKESFYKYFIKTMMQNDGGALVRAKVVIDGSGDKQFKRAFQNYLRRNIDPECVKEVRLKDSKGDPLLQLADMCAGAIARSYKTDRADCGRWRSILQRGQNIENVWNFK